MSWDSDTDAEWAGPTKRKAANSRSNHGGTVETVSGTGKHKVKPAKLKVKLANPAKLASGSGGCKRPAGSGKRGAGGTGTGTTDVTVTTSAVAVPLPPLPWRVPPSGCGQMIRLGTDFSGLETPAQALEGLRVPFRHVFATEIQSHLRHFIRKHFPVEERVYKDVQKRSVHKMLPVDLYVAGPPCQPWSKAGKMMGLEDMKGRGVLLFSTLEYISQHRPKVVVLENVATLARPKFKANLEALCQFLQENLGYEVHWAKIDTLDHGLPQARSRVYIVGFRLPGQLQAPFSFPEPLPHRLSISKVLMHKNRPVTVRPATSETALRNISKAQKECPVFDKKPVFVDIDAGPKFAHWTVGHLPCLTASRGSTAGYYVSTLGRRLTVDEMMKFQGMSPSRLAGWEAVMKERQMGHAIGNAMSVNVLQRVLVRALLSSGLVPAGSVTDPWEDPKYTPWSAANCSPLPRHSGGSGMVCDDVFDDDV